MEALTAYLPSSTGAVAIPALAKAEAGRHRDRRRLIAVAVSVAVLAAGGTAAFFVNRASQAQRAQARLEALVADVAARADADDYAPALVALEEAERLAPADTRLPGLAARISDTRDIVTTPAGASVLVKPYDDIAGPWRPLGRTPLTKVRLAKDVLRWKIELNGYEPLEVIGPSVRPFPPLVKAGQYPAHTLLINRGPVFLSLTGYDYTKFHPAEAFLIDRFEVTNRQYKAFVDAGGYSRREYWQKDILKDARAIPWEQAMSEFRDRTGRPGPATWEVGTYPAGQENHPVTGVSWYEAEAFATFSKRSLPTVYHWLRAAGVGAAAYMSPLSNLNGKGPAPVASFAGLSPVGAADMAGNAKEWCANEVHGTHNRYVLGGSWRDAVHMFYFADARQPFDRSDDNGFRLATYLEQAPAATLTAPIPVPARDFRTETPVSDQMFTAYTRLYAYDPRPLDARLEARDESAADWVREKVSFRAAYGDERVVAYLFLPKHVKPPYQTIVYAPAASAVTNRGFDVGSGGHRHPT